METYSTFFARSSTCPLAVDIARRWLSVPLTRISGLVKTHIITLLELFSEYRMASPYTTSSFWMRELASDQLEVDFRGNILDR